MSAEAPGSHLPGASSLSRPDTARCRYNGLGERDERRTHDHLPALNADQIAEAHFDLVEVVGWRVINKWRFPARLHDDIFSAAGLALVNAARKWERSAKDREVRGFLFYHMFFDVLDDVRDKIGRRGSAKANAKTVALTKANPEDEEYDWLGDPNAHVDFEKVGDAEVLRDFLDRLPDDRYREIALRLVYGESQREVGERFGITESRVSQMTKRMQRALRVDDDPEDEGNEREREEVRRCRRRVSLNVNWT